MDIRIVRIDDRLIHGQVATVWAKSNHIDRIIVVSDEVAKDAFRKIMLQQAAPPGVKANVVTIDKMIQVYFDPRFIGVRVMLLFTNPKDVVRLVKARIPIQSVNIGGMSFSPGKKMVTNAVAVNKEDADQFAFLHQRGIELEIRKVITDGSVQLMDVLRKERFVE